MPHGGEGVGQGGAKKVRLAVAGLGFGAAFVPIYLHHPDVAYVGLIEPDRQRLEAVGERFGISRRHGCLEEVLAGADYDAVHLVTPIPRHAAQTLAVLASGRHCACTVPMATRLEDLAAIVAAQRRSGRNYMMMETAVYTREFLMAQELQRSGQLGRIQFLRGSHYQDMEEWPDYWAGLPPMWYATHAVAPGLALAGARAVGVHCYGSGAMRAELQAAYGNPYPIETALFRLSQPGLALEITRSLFQTARGYQEGFFVYGERMSLEWPQVEGEAPVLFRSAPPKHGTRGSRVSASRQIAPDRQDLLPPAIARFTVRGRYDDTNPQQAFETGGGHQGSHPHLVHEFVRSIVEERKPWIDAVRAADWTAAGLCAHASALQDGARVEIPSFE